MPTIDENKATWGREYQWPALGDEWSEVWGGAETHWRATILPRVWPFLGGNILEIAPGYGRWSGRLINYADSYIGIDLAPECTEACRERFKVAEHARFETNDGSSLEAVQDGSIDFAFSFDSLVHVELGTLQSYLGELKRKLSSDGVAFLHHSNLGEFSPARIYWTKQLERVSSRVRPLQKPLRAGRLIEWKHWRAPSVSAAKVADAARHAGLACIGQEIINWGHHSRQMIDCLSLFTLPNSKWDRPNVVVRNPNFMAEAFSANAIARVYTSLREG